MRTSKYPCKPQAKELKRTNDYESATLLSELNKAAKQCSKGLTYKDSVSGYLRDVFSKNSVLKEDVETGKYRISKYLMFEITEPKRREICATRFRDRVWQKSMCNNGVREQLLSSLIYDNGACQKHKGVDFAVDRTICFLQRYFRKHHNNDGRYDHLDIKGYFPNTPHILTKETVEKYVKDAELRQHIFKIIDSFKDSRSPEEVAADRFGERGTALGSEISQLLQLALPSYIDHAIKEKLHIEFYERFNDDMLIISDSPEELAKVRNFIINEYAKLGLEVTIKQKNAKLCHGIKFLKRRIILTNTGKVIVKVAPEKIRKERRVLRKLKDKLDRGEIELHNIEEHYQSVRAGIARCDSKFEVKKLDSYYKEVIGQEPPKPKRRKKNAYCKSKQGNREKRGRIRKNESGERQAQSNNRLYRRS